MVSHDTYFGLHVGFMVGAVCGLFIHLIIRGAINLFKTLKG